MAGGARNALDIGCAEGDLARVLIARGARVSGVELDAEAAERARPDLERLIVGDLEQLDLVAEFGPRSFDTVILGDVLEHLREPDRLLRQARELLTDGGQVLLSVPNVAHAAVRLSLLLGRWEYNSLGLLDATHVRFFTRVTVAALIDACGLVPTRWERTTAGPFETELGLREDEVDAAVLQRVLADPDAAAYQFVVSAVRRDDSSELASLRLANAQLETARADAEQLRRELAEARTTTQDLAQAAEALTAEATQARTALAQMRGSTSWRLSAPVRAAAPARRAAGVLRAASGSLRTATGRERAATVIREQGLRGALQAVRRREVAKDDYADWVRRHDTLNAQDRLRIAQHVDTWDRRPLVSVIVPAYNSEEQTLREAIDSVLAQLYPHWELLVVDDGSPQPTAMQVAQEYAARDPRIQALRLDTNRGISAATNTALERARGEYVAFLDHDDVLAPHALYLVVDELLAHPDAVLVYTDEDKLDAHGNRHDPVFKPEPNLDLLLAVNYINHLTVIQSALLRELGGLRPELDGSQDHDLLLRVIRARGAERLRRVPHIAYHWRAHAGAATYSSRRRDDTTARSRAAVTEHLALCGTPADVVPAPRVPTWNRVVWPLPQDQPEVTVIVPTRDGLDLLKPCIDGLLHRTDYASLRVVIADNDSAQPATLDYLRQVTQDPRVTVLPAPGPFNYSAINNAAVRASSSPYVLLLNNDVIVRNAGWLREMMSHVVRPGVGVVGAKLLYGSGRVQHAGVVLGIGGVAGHSHKHRPASEFGYGGRLILTQEFCAVTGACLLTSRALWDQLGGLNETELGIALNDVDFCLRAREVGQRVIWTPYAELDHLESASRGLEDTPDKLRRFDAERAYMLRRWGPLLAADPAYNPNLTVIAEDFSRADPPRAIRPWRRPSSDLPAQPAQEAASVRPGR